MHKIILFYVIFRYCIVFYSNKTVKKILIKCRNPLHIKCLEIKPKHSVYYILIC